MKHIRESKKLVKEGAGAGYTVNIKDLKFGKIIDYKLEKGEKSWEDSYKVKVEVVPGVYKIAAEDYYNDFFWQEHEFGETPDAQIDGGYAIFDIALDGNPDEDDEALFQMNRELENRELDISFDYGEGWTHVDLPREGIELDQVDINESEIYFGIDKLVLNAPDLADAVNCGFQSIYDRDEEDPEEDEDDVVTESYDDEWAAVGAAFDEFRQRLWKYTRKDRKNRMEFFQDCMKKCEEGYKLYHDACVAED